MYLEIQTTFSSINPVYIYSNKLMTIFGAREWFVQVNRNVESPIYSNFTSSQYTLVVVFEQNDFDIEDSWELFIQNVRWKAIVNKRETPSKQKLFLIYILDYCVFCQLLYKLGEKLSQHSDFFLLLLTQFPQWFIIVRKVMWSFLRARIPWWSQKQICLTWGIRIVISQTCVSI